MPEPLTEPMTYREYLLFETLSLGAPAMLAVEAVSSWALDHPGIDMDETRTYDEWRSSDRA